jgi:hypothetical protein
MYWKRKPARGLNLIQDRGARGLTARLAHLAKTAEAACWGGLAHGHCGPASPGRRGDATPASELVAEVQWGLRLKHQLGGGNPLGMDWVVGLTEVHCRWGGGGRRPAIVCGEEKAREARNARGLPEE